MVFSSSNSAVAGQLLPFERVVETLEQDILRGRYRPSDHLPSLKDIGNELDVHYLTVRKAIGVLAERGLVTTARGARATVNNLPSRAKKRTLQIAVIYWEGVTQVHAHHPMLMAYLEGIGRRCRPGEAEVRLLHHRDGKMVEDLGRTLSGSQLDGALHVGFGAYDAAFLAAYRIPLVSIGQTDQPHAWETVVEPDITSAWEAVFDHLLSLGHRRITAIHYRRGLMAECVKQACERMVSACPEADFRSIPLDNDEGKVKWDQAERLFQIKPFPTAVIALDEFLVDAILKGCLKRNIAVPEELSLAAIQDLWSDRHGIGITAAYTFEDVSRMAYEAADLLIRRIQGHAVPHIVKTDSNLVRRESTAAPRTNLVLEGDQS